MDNMDTTADWRIQFQPDARQSIVNKIMETLKRRLPISSAEGFVELNKIAARFEDKIFNSATSESDYLRRISVKMLTMETKSQTIGTANTLPSNSAVNIQHPRDPVYYDHENEQSMDCNSWRPTQAEPNMDTINWRTQLHPDSRQRVVNKIIETLMRHLPVSGPEGLVELHQIATGFEEKIYSGTASESDYVRTISLKLLTMGAKSQTGGMANTLPSNSAATTPDPGLEQWLQKLELNH